MAVAFSILFFSVLFYAMALMARVLKHGDDPGQEEDEQKKHCRLLIKREPPGSMSHRLRS